MIDIRGFSREERIHKLVLETALRHSTLAFYQKPTGIITDNDLYEIFSNIEHRIYYTVDMPKFEYPSIVDGNFTTKYISCVTISADDIKELTDTILSDTEDRYFIYYNISLSDSFGKSQYSIRGAFIDDPVMRRDKKINTILGE